MHPKYTVYFTHPHKKKLSVLSTMVVYIIVTDITNAEKNLGPLG